MSYKRKQITHVGILEIFIAIVAIENPESEDPLPTDEVPGPFGDAGGVGGRLTVDEIHKVCGSWKAPSHFSAPGLAVFFHEVHHLF